MNRASRSEAPRLLVSRRRPLTAAELRLLRYKIRNYQGRPTAVARATGAAGTLVIGALWLATLLVTDAPWWVVTGFWVVAGGSIHIWAMRDLGREFAHLPRMVKSFESAVRRCEAESFDIRARSFAELEEVEDEGACYAFDLGEGRLVFLSGQEFYPSARFPSLDFSVVYPLDEAGRPADMWIEKRGPTARPVRTVPARVKLDLADALPPSLQVVAGTLADLEGALRAGSA